MAKRFIDTDLWCKKWFRLLDPRLKLFWVYLLSRCNHAGIYEVDLELAQFQLGFDLSKFDILKSFNGNIKNLDDDKWFIPKFIQFQYGPLNDKVNAHKSVIGILKRYKLLDKNQELINSSSTNQDKDINKDMDQGMFNTWWKIYNLKIGKQKAMYYWKKNVTEDLYNKIMQHTMEYVKGEKQYRKHPERYLRDKKWEDEIVVETKIELKDFKLDTTGYNYIGYCDRCNVSGFYKKEHLNGDSSCCSAKIKPAK